MSKPVVYLFLFDGFSDWEPSYVIAQLNRSDKYALITFSLNGKLIRSMGGLNINPDIAITDVKPELAEMIILPGGDAWEEKKNREIVPLITKFNKLNKKIAAICGATLLLADMGLLDMVKHTSNGDFFLKKLSENYKGEKFYMQEPAVADKNIITASGIYPMEFAKEIFQSLNLMNHNTIEKWFQLFKNGIWAE